MKRAALLIGVARTGQLPVLQAVGKGIQEMVAWAESQRPYGMGTVLVVSDSNDEQGKPVDPAVGKRAVTAAEIKTAIKQLIAEGSEQLFVYYAGHGANVRYNEIWLLSGAPEEANEAVNLDGSIKLARQSGIPHVVIISDACRTAAASIQAQAVEGSLIFPNTGPKSRPGSVDVFYATVVGSPALEISKSGEQDFVAIYTRALTDGLSGRAESERADDSGAAVARVKAWPLRTYLEAAVPDLLTAAGAPWDVNQSPDAIITSPPTTWLSQLPDATPKMRGRREGSVKSGGVGAVTHASLRAIASSRIQAALTPRRRMRGNIQKIDSPIEWPDESRYIPAGMECGFVVLGTEVADVIAAGGYARTLGAGAFEISNAPRTTNVLLEFADRTGVLLTAIGGFVAVVIVRNGEVLRVSYRMSPSGTLPRELEDIVEKNATLRDEIAEAARRGVLQPDEAADRDRVLGYLASVDWLDPSTVLYVCYALAAFGHDDQVQLVANEFENHLGVRLFDVELLADRATASVTLFPAVPMLTRGWALLDANGVELPPSLRGLARHVIPSLWTAFDADGVALVRAAITSKEIR